MHYVAAWLKGDRFALTHKRDPSPITRALDRCQPSARVAGTVDANLASLTICSGFDLFGGVIPRFYQYVSQAQFFGKLQAFINSLNAGRGIDPYQSRPSLDALLRGTGLEDALAIPTPVGLSLDAVRIEIVSSLGSASEPIVDAATTTTTPAPSAAFHDSEGTGARRKECYR